MAGFVCTAPLDLQSIAPARMKRDHEGAARVEVDDTARRAAQHPYGVQPSAANETETAEHRQLVLLLKNQHTLDCLDDALLLAALGWLDAPSLCFMGATSRRLYSIAHASMLYVPRRRRPRVLQKKQNGLRFFFFRKRAALFRDFGQRVAWHMASFKAVDTLGQATTVASEPNLII